MENAVLSMIDRIESLCATATGPPPVERLDRAPSHGGVVSLAIFLGAAGGVPMRSGLDR
jgi:hypothetical protein